MKIAYTTACVTTPDKAERMIHYLKESCDRLGIPLRPYGVSADAVYRGWIDIKIDKFCVAAKEFAAEGYTHIFYTDGRDSFMIGDAEEIESKYRIDYGSPPYLVSCEDQCYPFRDLSHHFPDPGHGWRYIGAGSFICEIGYALDMWEKLGKLYRETLSNENHDQGWLQMGYVEGHLDPKEFVLDTDCDIFQCVREHIGKPLSTSNLQVCDEHRIYNSVTATYPQCLHFPGGYSDPVTGKDHVLEPAWRELGLHI